MNNKLNAKKVFLFLANKTFFDGFVAKLYKIRNLKNLF